MRHGLSLLFATLLFLAPGLLRADTWQDGNVRFTLPHGWTVQSRNPALLVFRSDIEERQLTVSVTETHLPIGAQEFQRIVQKRIEAERQHLGKDDKVIEEAIEEDGKVRRAIYSVQQKKGDRLATGIVVGTPHVLAIFYLESVESDPKSHIEMAEAIMTSAQVR